MITFSAVFLVELLPSSNHFLFPLNGKKVTYLRAQAYALRVNGFTVKEIAKKLEKSERWVVKWSTRSAEHFEDKPKVIRDAAIQVLNKAK